MGSGNNFKLLHERKDDQTKDHFSGKYLHEFSLSMNEFELLKEMEHEYWRHSRGLQGLDYLRGMKIAFDVILETHDAWKLSLNWQAALY